jgi:DegV family protein with EDD domain
MGARFVRRIEGSAQSPEKQEAAIPDVAVVTDSAACLPEGVAEDLGIAVVSIHVRIGDQAVPDGEGAGFYKHLRDTDDPVATSTPSPGDFLEAFERTGAAGVVCVTIASSLSGIHQAASIAAADARADIEIVDSGAVSMAQGFVAMEAARATRAGGDLAQAAARARDVAGRVTLMAAIETLEYLRRSGRVNRLLSYAGTMLNVKPVFRMRGGEIGSAGRPRTRRRALDRLADEARSDIGVRPAHLAAVHADAEEDAHDLLESVAGQVEVVESHVAAFTPAMGAHTGPGAVGLAWFCD